MHTTLPRVPCSVRVCRAVKTSSNYLLMVFIPRSHPESQSAGLLLVNVPHSGRWLAELFPPRIQFVTLSECCKGIHINSEEDQTIIIRSHSYKTSSHRVLPLPCQHQNTIDKGQCSGHVILYEHVLLPLGYLGWLCLRICCLYEAGLSPQHPLPSTRLQQSEWRPALPIIWLPWSLFVSPRWSLSSSSSSWHWFPARPEVSSQDCRRQNCPEEVSAD